MFPVIAWKEEVIHEKVFQKAKTVESAVLLSVLQVV